MEVIVRGGKVGDVDSPREIEQRNDKNLAHSSLFLSTSKRICTDAEQALEEDKTSFMAKS